MNEPDTMVSIGEAARAVVERLAPNGSQLPAHVDEATAILHMIERAARDPSVDIEKLEKLMALRDRMAERSAVQAFDQAMTACQGEMRAVAADSNNPQTKSKYASYLALDRALRPTYTKHGFAPSFNTGEGAPEQYVRVLCRVSHKNGHSRDYHIDMPADGKGAKGGDVMTRTHATGSAVSYGMRYLLKMIFNIAVGEDDDGNAAGAGDKISEQQLADLIALADEVGADKIRFCKYMGVPSFADLPAKQFNRAVAALEAKRTKVAS